MEDRRNGELGAGMIEHYDVRGLIGRSEWSAVYDALDVPAGRRVALRVLSVPDACAARARLSLSSVVSHPNVIQLRGVREREDDWLVTAELVVYGSFAEFLKRSERVSPELAVHIVTDAARGLAAAHERGMVHGAVRPSNIVLTGEGSKLCDLGFREIRESILAAKGVPLPLEALAYQAPEVVGAGQPTSPLSDLYSLGATLYHLLTGVPPFAGETPPELVFRIVCETVKPLAECCPVALPDLLCDVVHRLLAKDPSERYPSAGELIADLEQVASQWKAGRAHVAPRPAARDMAMQIETDVDEDALEDDAPDVQLGTQDMMAQADMGGDEDAPEDNAPIVQPRARDMMAQEDMCGAEEDDSPRGHPVDENVQFTVYRPKRVAPMKWAPLLAFAHLSSRPPDAPDDEPDPVEEVKRQADTVLRYAEEDYQNLAQDSRRAVPREGEITFVPTMEGVEFNPPSRTFLWQESVHREEFRMRAAASLNERVARGRMTVFLGSIILAEIDLAIAVSDAVREPDSRANVAPASAQPYHDIFASYSHADESIVLEYQRFVESVGHQYLRDCVSLRAGQEWSHELEVLIEKADIFQLFWSSNSMRSPFVEQEWRYALSLPRRQFIRPTYWEDPLPELPERGVPTDDLRR
ncbi:protein kinase, partial [bacterium]|nr:protein kinase [bacterium]